MSDGFNIRNTLRSLRIGQTVTIFTTAGGTGGGGYTGTIINFSSGSISLLLSASAGPTGVTGAFGTPGAAGAFGAVVTIPINQITSITQNAL
ncbi:hypothetical protein LSG31_20870 [Fodinisporobacter ferrooxydans]|uniref:Uncharacterized protein n=1 Tax=Fodinisporobacter ferrooxydans TaxID=2901836 RepID=A0ABY4CIE4_9BACL|nr:hypothetical protein LSG31_20870 [Alicyclobacillaceae bacterium MYW30-H2]